MKKVFPTILTTFILVIVFMPISNASSEVYTKPEFHGRVIDAETKQPIEGAVAVVIYHRTAIFGFVDVIHGIADAVETLTDKKGEFSFPAYNYSNPLWREDIASFIFFKPGYMSSQGPSGIGGLSMIEKYFSISESEIGKVGEIKLYKFHTWYTWTGPLGIVELKKAKSYEERRKAPNFFTGSLESKDLPLLYKAIDEAENNLKKEGIR